MRNIRGPMGSICPATFRCRKQAITAHEISNSCKLGELASLESTTKFHAFLEERIPKGGNGKSNAQLIISNELSYVNANASTQPTITYVTPNVEGLRPPGGPGQEEKRHENAILHIIPD